MNNKLLNSNRILIFDKVRGVSILAIVFYHFLIAFPGSYVVLKDSGNISNYFIFHFLPTNILSLILRFGWQFVGVFLFLSGFGLTYSYLQKDNHEDFLLNRLKKLFPVWQLAIIFAYVTNIVISHYGKGIVYNLPSLNIKDYWYLFIFPFYVDFRFFYINKINDTLWFIVLILQFYFLFPILVNTMNRLKLKKYVVLSLLLTVIFRFLIITIYSDGTLPFNFASSDLGILMKTIPARFFEFSLGMITAKAILEKKIEIDKLVNLKSFVFGLLLWFLGTVLGLNIYGWVVSDIFITVGLLLLSICLFSWINFKWLDKILITAGVYSLYIYVFHGNLMKIMGILIKYEQSYIKNNDILFLSNVFALFIISCVIFLKKNENKSIA